MKQTLLSYTFTLPREICFSRWPCRGPTILNEATSLSDSDLKRRAESNLNGDILDIQENPHRAYSFNTTIFLYRWVINRRRKLGHFSSSGFLKTQELIPRQGAAQKPFERSRGGQACKGLGIWSARPRSPTLWVKMNKGALAESPERPRGIKYCVITIQPPKLLPNGGDRTRR